MKRLENKVAVIYGNGAVGGAIAVAFANEGARVFLSGLTPTKLKTIADKIASGGGSIEATRLDALNEQAVEKHLQEIIEKTGKVDISFNAVGIPYDDVQDLPLTVLSVESFFLPITTYMKSNFITAKAAAIQMVKQGNGVILMHTPNASRISPPFAGGLVPAWAGMEALCRSLSVECGPQGVRAVCLLTTSLPETPLIQEVSKVHAKTLGVTVEQFNAIVAGNTHRKRLTTLKELTDSAVFAVSDEGSAITGTILNLSAGSIC